MRHKSDSANTEAGDQLFVCVLVCAPADRDGNTLTFRPGDLCRASELRDPPHPGHWLKWPATTLELRKAERELGVGVEMIHAIESASRL